MKLLADHCVFGRTVRALREAGHSVICLRDIGKEQAPDDDVVSIARDRDLVLVTADLDFSDILRYPPGNHPGILVLRVDPVESITVVEGILLELLSATDRETLRSALVVVSSGGYRIRRSI